MKGIIFRQLYGEFCDYRPSGDEDILIRKSEYEQVSRVLATNGYITEQEDVTPSQFENVQEISFYNPQRGLTIEVHVNPFGTSNDLRMQLNNCFQNVFQDCCEELIDGTPVTTMSHTDHILFSCCMHLNI